MSSEGFITSSRRTAAARGASEVADLKTPTAPAEEGTKKRIRGVSRNNRKPHHC